MPRPALIVEDDPVSAAVLADWLRAAGWDPVVVERGEDALAAVAARRPQLALVDLVLPGQVDGAALAAHLRLDAGGAPIALVMMSARADAGTAALAAGGGRFLPKPVGHADLLVAVAEACAEPDRSPELAPAGGPPLPAPQVPVAGDAASGATRQEGDLGPEAFLAVLRRLHEQRFSGLVTVEKGGVPARIALRRGNPVSVLLADPASTFGRVLVDLGLVVEEVLESHAAAGRRAHTPLGEILLRAHLIDRRAVELALREQVVRRLATLAAGEAGGWTATPTSSLGQAGFEVHLAVVSWRLRDTAGDPPLPEDGFGHLPAWVRAYWRLLDPTDTFAVPRGLLFSGSPLAEVVALGGPDFEALLRHLAAWGLLTVRPDPPRVPEEARPTEAFLSAFADGVVARHRLWADASHYTVLGVGEDADTEAVEASAVAALAAWHPDGLPSGLDVPTRQRARELHARILEAGRVLADPARRRVYDARLRGDAQIRGGGGPALDAPALLAERARQLLRQGNAVVAAGHLCRAVEASGHDPALLLLLAEARRAACPEDRDVGEAELRRALAVDPTDEATLVALGDVLGARGATAEARAAYRAALRRNFAYEPARDSLRALERRP